MSESAPLSGGTAESFPRQGHIAVIVTEDGTTLYFDPAFGYFQRVPGPRALSLAGDGTWQQFPVAIDVFTGLHPKFHIPGSELLIPSPMVSLEWRRRIEAPLTSEELLPLQFVLSYL